MSQFTFNLNGVAVDTAKFDQYAAAGDAKVGSSLYSNTKDENLTYTGSDTVVWDRINAERLRRGLPSLTDIGYPRPPEDATPAPTEFNGSSPSSNSETFTVKGPPGMTFEQAKAIFEQQNKSGGLVGFKVGDSLSAATQAADGLPSAQAQLQQSIGGITGKLPSGTNLNSITAAVGSNGEIGQFKNIAGSVQSGVTSAGFDPRTGRSAAVDSAFATGGVAGAVAALGGQSVALFGPLSGAAGAVGSIANKVVGGLTRSIGGVPTQGINTADFAKQAPALGDIGNLSKADVTGVLAQTSKLIGQSSNQISSALGVGKFGFDASQLEKAGLVKPGTSAAFLSQGQGDLVEVLKSPTVWTGKDGVKGLEGLLNNSGLQDKVQQGLMSSGLTELKALGVPTDSLKPQALAGLATNAAKSVPDTLKWATGSGAIPGLPTVPGAPALPADVSAKFNTMATNGAFAVKLTEDKVEPPLKQEVVVEPAINTVNAATVDAAATRVVGNDKVPTVAAGQSGSAEATILAYIKLMNTANASFDALAARLAPLTQQDQISQDEWSAVNEEYILIKATFNSKNAEFASAADAAIKVLPQSDPDYTRLVNLYNGLPRLFKLLKAQSETIKKIIADLANKIRTVQNT